MTSRINHSDLEAYLDEALPPDDMTNVEAGLREEPELLQELAAINGRRDAGLHTLGEIWRRHRVSCPTREQLGSYLLKAVSDELADYVEFHLAHAGCRFCIANLEDLQRQQEETKDEKSTRRRRYFDSSAGYLQNE
jgi:hypothetical protein